MPLVPAWLRWTAVLGTAVVILYFSIVPPPSGGISMGPFGLISLSYWLHTLAYLGLSVVLAYALQSSPRPDWQILLIVFALAVGYGISIELIQLPLPTRSFDVRDILVNGLGAALAVTGWKIATRYVRFYRLRRRERSQSVAN